MSARPARTTRIRRRSQTFRRITGGLALLFALVTIGFTYAALAPTAQTANADEADPVLIAEGQQLYDNSCITCHGQNLQGVVDRGPSLIGVGEAAVYFQVATGRMPAVENSAQIPAKTPVFDERETAALGQFIQSKGGGPVIPPDEELINMEQVAKGGELYRLNCASCHNFTGLGGALSSGKYAPDLGNATDRVIWGAMLSGPQNMPKFGDGQLTPDEKAAVVAFIQNNKASLDPGGYGLGGFGPAPEGLAAFLVGMGAIVALTLWMGSRA